MKTNSKKKIVVSTLAIAMGAALVGSISGSVAWYQYSTRTTASMTATSAGTSRNLQVRLSGDDDTKWRNDITIAEVAAYLEAKTGENVNKTSNLAPITTGSQAKDAALPAKFKGHPVYQYKNLPDAKGDEHFTVEFEFRCVDQIGTKDVAANTTYAAKNIYLVDANIKKAEGSAEDISNAIRLHFAGNDGTSNVYALASKTGAETATSGKLDLLDDGIASNDIYDSRFDTETGEVVYGEEASPATNKQTAYSLSEEGSGKLLADDTDAYTFSGGVALQKTKADGTAVKLTMTVWMEGWAKLADDSAGKTVWDVDYLKQSADINLRFACEADK